MYLCLKEKSPQGPCHPHWRGTGIPALWLRSSVPIRPFRMVFLLLQAARDSSSPRLGAVCLFPCATSRAQPPWCCLGPGSLLECGCVQQGWARPTLKQECSNSHPDLCGSRHPRTFPYLLHTASHDKMAASCQAGVAYSHCLASVIGLVHSLHLRAVRDQRGGFPARDMGGVCRCGCLGDFTVSALRCVLGHHCTAWGMHLKMFLDLPAREHQAVSPCPSPVDEKPMKPCLLHQPPFL